MRVLIVGNHQPWRMEAAVERALRRAGHQTLLVDDRRTKRFIGWRATQRLVALRARRFRPDFVFLSKCLALDLETVSGMIDGLPNALWYHDPQWFREMHRRDIRHVAEVGRLAQTFFVTGFQNDWRALGLNAKFLPAAGASEILPTAYDERFASDVAFIGTGYDPSRTQLLLDIAPGNDLRVWGLGWEKWKDELNWSGRPVEREEFAKVCSSSKITLGINPARAAGGTTYTSDRTWMVILGGAFYLGQGTPGITSYLRDGVECAWYTDAESCRQRIAYYLAHPAEREEIRRAGEKFVRDHHTYDQRIQHLLTGTEYVEPSRE